MCGTIKVSITADSWHVGASGLITMLVFFFTGVRSRQSSNNREDEKPKLTAKVQEKQRLRAARVTTKMEDEKSQFRTIRAVWEII